jgi:hypothetical protein
MKHVKILLILVPLSALVTSLLFLDAAERYSGQVRSWPGQLAQPRAHPYSAVSDRILLFPVRMWERRGLAPGEYPRDVHSDDSWPSWTCRFLLQGLYVYGAGLGFYLLGRLVFPKGTASRRTWLVAGLLFIVIFIPSNLTEWSRTDCCPDHFQGWPLWIAARDYDTGGDPAIRVLWRGHRPAALVNASLLLFPCLGVARILLKLNSSEAIAGGGAGR